jgi:hypothetical protein
MDVQMKNIDARPRSFYRLGLIARLFSRHPTIRPQYATFSVLYRKMRLAGFRQVPIPALSTIKTSVRRSQSGDVARAKRTRGQQ